MTDPEIAILMLGNIPILLVLLGFPIAFTFNGNGSWIWILRLLRSYSDGTSYSDNQNFSIILSIKILIL